LRVARKVWPDEVAKWGHLSSLSIVTVTGDLAERHHNLYRGLANGALLFTINYENLPWLEETLRETNTPWPFQVVVLDESTRVKSYRGSIQQSSSGTEFVRNAGAIRARALAKVVHTRVHRVIELTGTPSPNGLIDLWGQAWFLDGGQRLGRTYDGFSKRWFHRSPTGYGMVPTAFAHGEISGLLKDICLTLDPKDWFDLKEPIVTPVYVDLPPAARRMYKAMEDEMFLEIQGHDVEAFNAASRTMKCLQLANGAIYVGDPDAPGERQWKAVHEEKLLALESIVEEAAGAPVLVAYHFKSDLARLMGHFPKARVLESDADVDDWNAGKIPVLFAHPASAGHGLNLQHGGNIIVFFGHNWDLEQFDQIVERIGPMRQLQSGYERPVFIYHIVARKTVDELVMQRRDSKRAVQDLLLEAAKRRTIQGETT
jgi:SNF2 family DNA or RNA helicase